MTARPKRRAATTAPGRAVGKTRPNSSAVQQKAAANMTEPAPAPAVDPFHLKLEADCTLRAAADLQFSLLIANGEPLVVDGSDVQRIDTAGLQLLVALVRRQQQAGRRLEWKAASPELLKCGRRLGLIDALGLAAAHAGDAP